MLETTNYKFKKPELTDSPPDITVMNPNWDSIDTKLKDNETQINSLDVNKLNKIKQNWLSATLLNGWAGIIYYRKNQIDLIEFQGSLTVGTLASGTIIATLPEGYRPSRATPIAAYVSTNSKVVSGLVLSNTGEFRIYAPAITELSSGNTIAFSSLLP